VSAICMLHGILLLQPFSRFHCTQTRSSDSEYDYTRTNGGLGLHICCQKISENVSIALLISNEVDVYCRKDSLFSTLIGLCFLGSCSHAGPIADRWCSVGLINVDWLSRLKLVVLEGYLTFGHRPCGCSPFR